MPRHGNALRNVDGKTLTITSPPDDKYFVVKQRKPFMRWLCSANTAQKLRYKFVMKPGAPPLQTTRSPGQVREPVWSLHYSLKIEKT